jgi:tetratricopeptide (TPR) repeat protein
MRPSICITLLLLLSSLLAAADPKIAQVNAVISSIKDKNSFNMHNVNLLAGTFEAHPECVYCHQLLGFLKYKVGDYFGAYSEYKAAMDHLERYLEFGVVYFYDSSIIVRKEDLLFNLGMTVMRLSNKPLAEKFIAEAVKIADEAHSYARQKPLISPRSRVYQTVLADYGINYDQAQPMIETIESLHTLRGISSAVPWTIRDNYEVGDPLLLAPLKKKRHDSAGNYEFAQQRLPSDVIRSSILFSSAGK